MRHDPVRRSGRSTHRMRRSRVPRTLGDVAKCPSTEFVVQWDRHLPPVVRRHSKPPVFTSTFMTPMPENVYHFIDQSSTSGGPWSPVALSAGLMTAVRCSSSLGARPRSPFRAEMNMVSTPAGKREGLRSSRCSPPTPTPLDTRSGQVAGARLVM